MAGGVMTAEAGRPTRLTRWNERVWRVLRSRWLLLVCLLLLFGLLALSWMTPQMPGQVREDPVSATRWLNSTNAQANALGSLLTTLGLYSVLHSPLFKGLLVLLALLLLVQLLDQIALWRCLAGLPGVLSNQAPGGDAPLAIVAPCTLHRVRCATAAPAAAELLGALLHKHFSQVQRYTIDQEPAPDGAPRVEARLLGLRYGGSRFLRPLAPLGLLLAAAGLFVATGYGWDIEVTSLAPGDAVAYALHDVTIAHRLEQDKDAALRTTLAVAVDGVDADLPGQLPLNGRVDSAQVSASAGAPALWVMSADARMARAGENSARAEIGLTFPTAGSEELLLLPEQSVGLRIVRRPGGAAGAPTFLVEVLAENEVQPIQRIDVQRDQTEAIILGATALSLRFVPVPSIDVTVRRTPGLWLVWPGLALLLLGALGFWRRPHFAVVQVAPWPEERALVVIQSSGRDAAAALEAAVEAAV